MITTLVFFYVLKMHNLQNITTPKKAKKQLQARTKLSIDTGMSKTKSSNINCIQQCCSFAPFI